MKTFVCVKRVPDTSEAEVKVDASGKDVDSSRFSFDINDADNYAVEEAILIKEAQGEGTVQIVCIGPKDADIMIRMAMAKGGDSAVRIDDPRINVNDPVQIARVLAAVIKEQSPDLVLTGCMAGDDGGMAVGVALAEELGVSHAAMVKKVEMGEGKLKVHRELEGGISEVVELDLPAVLTIQTGINEPRYAPIRGIRKAQKKELKVLKVDELGLSEGDVNEASSLLELQRFYVPEVVSTAEVIEGAPEEKAEILADKLVKGGLL